MHCVLIANARRVGQQLQQLHDQMHIAAQQPPGAGGDLRQQAMGEVQPAQPCNVNQGHINNENDIALEQPNLQADNVNQGNIHQGNEALQQPNADMLHQPNQQLDPGVNQQPLA